MDSRARTAGRAVAPDARPPDGPDAAGAASTSDARVPDASAKASGASRSTRDGADAGALGPAPRGRHDRLLPTTGAAVGARARRADVVTRAAPRPWRTRCSGFERATAEALRTRDRRRRGASADAPRATTGGSNTRNPGFGTPQARTDSRPMGSGLAGAHQRWDAPAGSRRSSSRFSPRNRAWRRSSRSLPNHARFRTTMAAGHTSLCRQDHSGRRARTPMQEGTTTAVSAGPSSVPCRTLRPRRSRPAGRRP